MNDSVKKRLNGYGQLIGLVLAVGAVIWYASGLNSEVGYLRNEIIELKVQHKVELELLRDEIKELRLEIKVLKNRND